MDEKVFYQDSNVLVTESRFVTGGKTYAMKNISSIQMGKILPSTGFHLLIIIVCILTIILGDWGFKIAAAIIGTLIFLQMKTLKTKYTVRFSSNSGETDGLVSNDKDYIEQIIEAINNAMKSR